jgi:hypothetical protein
MPGETSHTSRRDSLYPQNPSSLHSTTGSRWDRSGASFLFGGRGRAEAACKSSLPVIQDAKGPPHIRSTQLRYLPVATYLGMWSPSHVHTRNTRAVSFLSSAAGELIPWNDRNMRILQNDLYSHRRSTVVLGRRCQLIPQEQVQSLASSRVLSRICLACTIIMLL